ncbi:acyl carrier protein [Pseudolysobacter antarcticus]|uniref:Acyl carrier protein n=1 Tax=Pseudolysobacter antarcticus TaxID=2511995 RepID=A0A411HJC7_9GAMM|nr:phosphopantetheine-binding protein [Pseudolysobacter antarcticus]QBB70514.1 acyl carrier protein [Pseudolysobacter antarcticus]
MTNDLNFTQIQAMLKDFLAEHFDVPTEKVTQESSLKELGIDSIMMLDIMLEIEDRLGIKLKDLSMPSNPKVGDIMALIDRNQAANKG